MKFRDEKTVSGIGGRAVKLVNHLALPLSDDPPACSTFSSSKLPRFASSLLTRWNRGRNRKYRVDGPTYRLHRACHRRLSTRAWCINGNYVLAMQRRERPRPRVRSSVNYISCDSLLLMLHSRASAMIILLNCWHGLGQDSRAGNGIVFVFEICHI